MTVILQRVNNSKGSGLRAALRRRRAGIRQLSIIRLRMIFEALEPEDQDPCRVSGQMSAKMMSV